MGNFIFFGIREIPISVFFFIIKLRERTFMNCDFPIHRNVSKAPDKKVKNPQATVSVSV